ncbi:hypothetical protein PsorP6_015372 [Peronosclerospora sorghi]|uniref:Uncharacterized protein n=1 Tax=Peronosclerospora sorghi TaxID=230839 RepID=A0ACC0WQ66_9STRA|nr:hypothetical protein PsorP6_015372 [Peronosclerospora sorghi]
MQLSPSYDRKREKRVHYSDVADYFTRAFWVSLKFLMKAICDLRVRRYLDRNAGYPTYTTRLVSPFTEKVRHLRDHIPDNVPCLIFDMKGLAKVESIS